MHVDGQDQKEPGRYWDEREGDSVTSVANFALRLALDSHRLDVAAAIHDTFLPRIYAAQRCLPPKAQSGLCQHETRYLQAAATARDTGGTVGVEALPPRLKQGLYDSVTAIFLAVHAPQFEREKIASLIKDIGSCVIKATPAFSNCNIREHLLKPDGPAAPAPPTALYGAGGGSSSALPAPRAVGGGRGGRGQFRQRF